MTSTKMKFTWALFLVSSYSFFEVLAHYTASLLATLLLTKEPAVDAKTFVVFQYWCCSAYRTCLELANNFYTFILGHHAVSFSERTFHTSQSLFAILSSLQMYVTLS